MDFAQLIQDANSFDALRPLLRALGFGRQWLELPREEWPEPLRGPVQELVERFLLAGTRAGLHAMVLQLPKLNATTAGRTARRLRLQNPARLAFYVFVERDFAQLALGAFGSSEDLRLLFIERASVRATDLDALAELVPQGAEGGLRLALRHAHVLDRSRVSQRFFLDFKAQRTLIADGWRGIPRAATDERRQLALLFLCRLMFLYFLQRRGHLGSEPEYLYGLWHSWTTRRHARSFYWSRIKPLFFGVLNRRPEKRSGAARRFGALPYLNGGLFDRHALERSYRALDLPDRNVRGALDDLLQRYRFTTQDAAQATAARTIDTGIDPEMLGRVFEELMAESQRGNTGTYFTPPAVVDRLVVRALHALTSCRGTAPDVLRDLRVLDPACGSGAFLLGALNRVAEARAVLEGRAPAQLEREIVERSLYGVDLQDDAALLCALRLWLCLLPSDHEAEYVRPLPNLDRNIRQGDALVDPIDLVRASVVPGDASWSVARSADVRAALRALETPAALYVTAEPEQRRALQQEIVRGEALLGRAWIGALQRALQQRERELRALERETDLFGERTSSAQQATRELAGLNERKLRLDQMRALAAQRKALPFFSFDIHFAEASRPGFDLIVSNPPWVRAHRWPETIGRVVRERYQVCRSAVWTGEMARSVPAAQFDLSLLFLERALRLLAPGGALAMLLPAKCFRSLYAASARALLLRESRITHIDDYSLDQRAIFRADAFAGALVAVRGTPDPAATIRVSCHQRGAPPLEFELTHDSLNLVPGELASPWLLVPPAVSSALRTMQQAGPAVGQHADLQIHRGVFTGANEVLLLDDVSLKLGDHAWVRAEGYQRTPAGRRRSSYRALIEESVLRPVVAGSGLRAWSFRTEQSIVWSHDAAGRAVPLPARITRYLNRHAQRLEQRSGWKHGQPLGAVFRVATHTLGPKLAWRDLAPTLEAVVLPARVRRWGRERELIPLNTVYYISPPDQRTALLLCACFNSLPVRTFARAIAERAKDAHFRFFAWVIAQIPMPSSCLRSTLADRLVTLAQSATDQAGMSSAQQAELDRLICSAYGLTAEQCAALAQYDHWLGAAHR